MCWSSFDVLPTAVVVALNLQVLEKKSSIVMVLQIYEQDVSVPFTFVSLLWFDNDVRAFHVIHPLHSSFVPMSEQS